MISRLRSARLVFRYRDIRLQGVFMLGRYQHTTSQTGLLPHSHRHAIEICFLERGEQTYRVGGLPYRLRGNDQFFTLPGEVHDTAKLPQERGILYWLILRMELAKGFLGLAQRAATALRRELITMPNRHFRAHPDIAHILAEIVELLGATRGRRDRFRGLRIQALLLQYLVLTIEASRQGLTGAATPLIQRLIHYIEGHLADPIQVARLAEVARLSESRCKARFKQEIGVPPAEFWMRKKIERAVVLLKSQSVTEVAYGLGFSSSQYFATVFRRYTLLNPSQFRGPARARPDR